MKIGGAALLGRALPSWTASVFAAPGTLPLGHLSPAAFTPHLDSRFVTDAGPLTLTRIVEQPRQGSVEQFSLLFRAAVGDRRPHGTYSFAHPALGRFDLFIAPVGLPAERATYEACFSRHVDAGLENKELRA